MGANSHTRLTGSDVTAHRDIVVVGASAGGVEALGRFVAGFPPDLRAAVFVVLHVMPGGTSVLSQILQRRTRLRCQSARHGEPIESGRVYVAPPDCHLLLSDSRVLLARGPRENGHRPAVDPLFRSAAEVFGRRVIGVVLSGALDDGAQGLRMIADAGGCALVQDPEEALYSSMPLAAQRYVQTAELLPVADLAQRICEIIACSETAPLQPVSPPSQSEQIEHSVDHVGASSERLPDLTCPECGGTLSAVEESGVARFRCDAGHDFSAGSLGVSPDALGNAPGSMSRRRLSE